MANDRKQFLIVVLPDTVTQWHRAGFQLYWRVISKVPWPGRQKANFERHPRFDIPNGRRESDVGCAPDSRRASHARFGCFRANHLPLDAQSAKRSWARQTLACVSPQPSRSHRGDGLLHRTNNHFRCALLLFFVISHDRRRILHSTSRHIRRACGLSSSCGKSSRMSPLPGFLFLIGMPNMGPRFPLRFSR